jgi:hypothetical protein
MRLDVPERPRRCGTPPHRSLLPPEWLGRLTWGLGVIVLACGVTGCASLPMGSASGKEKNDGFFGWHMQAPFDTSDVKTVFVSFKTQTFRRNLEQMLTEAVTKEINLRTPYRVVGDPNQADSILSGVITVTDKNLVVEAPTNLPRELNAMMTVWVKWRHREETELEKTMQPTAITEVNNFIPEVGETTLSAYYQITQNIAKQIVDMMEQPWFSDEDLK